MIKVLDPFFRFHPGADIAESLFVERDSWIRQIVNRPHAAIELLSEKYKFGNKTDFWDDYVFLLVISPALAQICALPELRTAINKYSELDHSLFLRYIRRDEEPDRFRRAFWNVNSFGKQLSARFSHEFCTSNHLAEPLSKRKSQPEYRSNKHIYRIAFVFKGGFSLAHSEFLHEFLRGARIFSSKVKITLILLDDDGLRLHNTGVEHIEIISFRQSDTYNKLERYYKFFLSQEFDHISWVACVQNLCLFMGQRLSSSQSYWSMKYHSIIMNSLDKYAGLGFGGNSFEFDDVKWFRGRAFPSLKLPPVSKEKFLHLKKELKIPTNCVIGGCFVRSEKLNNEAFWCLLDRLLRDCPELHFVIASQSVPAIASQYLDSPHFSGRFHHLGWVNTKVWCQNLDIYIDSFPRGSCLTALEAIKAKVPIVMFDSEHNRESSALPYLISAGQGKIPPGVFECEISSASYVQIKSLVTNKSLRTGLASRQFDLLRVLEGTSTLYAKDYLNFFLDESFSVHEIALK